MSNTEQIGENICLHNTFIFNWIENYDAEVKKLEKSMEELNNRVKVFNNLTYEQLFKAVDFIRRSNFGIYNYIVIIILENKSTYGRFIETSDGIKVLLNTEILTVIQTNRTLQNKPRLFVIQKLLDFKAFDDEDAKADSLKAQERWKRIYAQRYYADMKTLHQGLTITIKAQEYSPNYQASPFIETFCDEFKSNATTTPIDKIHSQIVQELKTNKKYNIAIQFGTNQTKDDNLIFGTALNSDELRDFFETT